MSSTPRPNESTEGVPDRDAAHPPGPLTPVDASWFRMEARRTPADIVSVMRLEGPIDDARLHDVIEHRLLTHPRFRRRVVDSRLGVRPPHWEEEPSFRIEDHIVRTVLAPPGDEAALAALLQTIANRPLDFTRSPWRVWAIDGVMGGSALVSHLHHCMGDGFALLHLLLSLADPLPGAAPEPAPPPPRSPPAASWPVDALQVLRTVEEDARALGHLLLLPFDPKTSLRGRLSGERRLAFTAPFELRPLRDGAHARGATVNDAVMSAIAGTLRRYFEERGEAPLRVRGIVPVNLRPPSQPVDEDKGNFFGLIFVELPVDAPDREARLTAVKREMDRIKSSQEALVSLGVMNVLGRAPAVVDHIADELFARKGSLVITNVPGPREPISIAGQRILDMFFFAPHPWLGCGLSVLSYRGVLRLGVRTDAAIVPRPERLAALFSEEIAGWMAAPAAARAQQAPGSR